MINNKSIPLNRGVLLIFFLILGCSKNKNFPVDQATPDTTKTTIISAPPVIDPFKEILTDSSSNATIIYNFSSNPGGKKRGWQGCPSIGIENSNYYITWFANEIGEGRGSYLVTATSNDLGVTWQENSLMIAPDIETNRQMDPAMWNDKYGYLHLSWTTVKGYWDGASGGVWNIRIKKNTENKILITKPMRLFSGVMNVKPTFLGSDSSTMLFPVSGWNIGSTFDGGPSTPTPAAINGALLYKAKYEQTKKELLPPELYSKIPVVNSKRVIDEHMVVSLDSQDKTMTSLLRTYDGITISHSSDFGLTWEVPFSFTDLGEHPSSRVFFGKLKSGNLLFVYNNSKYRTNLTACLSMDNGKSWPYKMVIEKTGDATYPDVTQNKNDEICLTYDRNGRTVAGEIIFSKFTEKNIKDNDASKIFKAIVSKF